LVLWSVVLVLPRTINVVFFIFRTIKYNTIQQKLQSLFVGWWRRRRGRRRRGRRVVLDVMGRVGVVLEVVINLADSSSKALFTVLDVLFQVFFKVSQVFLDIANNHEHGPHCRSKA